MNDISGEWIGEYILGDCYDRISGKSVNFKMHLTVIAGRITGTCDDEDASEHFNQPATIFGFVEEGFISFVKKYPYLFSVDLKKNELLYQPTEKTQIVHYTGHLEDGVFEGDWEMVSTYKSDDGHKLYDDGYGTWCMHRA